jgi:UDP-glucose-4-epimerase GalE
MRDHQNEHIVFSSTCATYGNPDSVPIRENAPQRPINPYGASRLMVERMIQDFGSAYGLKSILLRYFNAAGADPEGDIGEDHDPETHLIPVVLDVASGRRPNVTVFGSDYPTPDGTCVRDYIHVADLAEAHVKALQALEGGLRTGAYNLGIERGFSVREVVNAACRITDQEIPLVLGKRRTGDPAALVSNATRARNDFNWRPKFADLTEIIRTAWAWHRRQDGSESQAEDMINT